MGRGCLLLGLGGFRSGWPLNAAVPCRSAAFFTGRGHLGMRFSILLPLFFLLLCVPQRDPHWAVANPCAVGGVLSELGFAGWRWCDWLPVEGAVCPFDIGLHDGRHRFDLSLPDRSWKISIVDSSPIWCDMVLPALSMDLN
jgi:hypothetical protein